MAVIQKDHEEDIQTRRQHIGRLLLLGLFGGVSSYMMVPAWYFFRKDVVVMEGETLMTSYLTYLKERLKHQSSIGRRIFLMAFCLSIVISLLHFGRYERVDMGMEVAEDMQTTPAERQTDLFKQQELPPNCKNFIRIFRLDKPEDISKAMGHYL